MTPQTQVRRSRDIFLAAIAGSSLLGGIYIYGSSREAGAAEVREKLNHVKEAVSQERIDRINADDLVRSDLTEIKKMQNQILMELRQTRR